jgi:hypothetical protein
MRVIFVGDYADRHEHGPDWRQFRQRLTLGKQPATTGQ